MLTEFKRQARNQARNTLTIGYLLGLATGTVLPEIHGWFWWILTLIAVTVIAFVFSARAERKAAERVEVQEWFHTHEIRKKTR